MNIEDRLDAVETAVASGHANEIMLRYLRRIEKAQGQILVELSRGKKDDAAIAAATAKLKQHTDEVQTALDAAPK